MQRENEERVPGKPFEQDPMGPHGGSAQSDKTPDRDRTGAKKDPREANVPPQDRCPWCGVVAPIVYVHGHGQCANCGTNREPCCQPD